MPNARKHKTRRAASPVEERRDSHLKRAIASRLRPALHRELMRTAKNEQRTMSTYIEMIVEEHFRAKRLSKARPTLAEIEEAGRVAPSIALASGDR